MASPKKFIRLSMPSNETLQLENAVIRDQLKTVVQILSDQTVLIKQLVKEKEEMNPIREHFPIKSEEQLIELEEKLKLNRSIYKPAMKSILQPAGVLSSLNFIMSEDIVLAYNVDGVQGKKTLRTHKEFFAALLGKRAWRGAPRGHFTQSNAEDE